MENDRLEKARQQLRATFGASLEDDLLEQCAEICKNNNITGEDVYYKWQAISYNTKQLVLNKDSVRAIKEELERDAAKVKAQRAQLKSNLGGTLKRNLGALGRVGAKVDPFSNKTASKTAAPTKTESRTVAGPSKVRITRGKEPIPRTYRYMYEKISDRSEALDDRIDEFAELVQKHYQIPDLGDPGASTEEEVTVVGRITFDSDSSSSGAMKLNEATLTLESSRAMGSGVRVPLRFDPNVKVREAVKGRVGIGLFPGAIVALRGKNGGGGWFLVSEVLTLPPMITDTPDLDGEPFSACIASGPFTSDIDLAYHPWQTALKRITSEKPDVILLIGPFIDSTHTCFKNGEINDTPAALFRKTFLDPLSEVLDKMPGAVALLVPSVKDALNNHAVFPQSELDAALTEDLRIHFLPNPCHFMLNDVPFAVSSVDVLFHLRKEEFFRRMSEIQCTFPKEQDAPASDTMANLCRHILEQRSFYPIFPVPHDVLHDVNLDVSHSEALKLGGNSIDNRQLSVLVLPSKLKHFTKTINNTTILNPSFTAKGTIASLTYEKGTGGQRVSDQFVVQIIHCD
ncbi:DNA polymerase alpha/epsilon subunit B-domain-containing protein [Cytidiella melzeri]|nr:DNA polymerase alpha/epsilon subunit B-domain-containing protein [Cytidiella melzeri]